MLDLLFDDTRWFSEDEVQFTVQASLSAIGGWVLARGAFAHDFLVSFSRSTGAGDQVYLASPYQSELEFDFILVIMTISLPSCERGIDSLPPCQSGTLLFVILLYQKGTTPSHH
jgi:hypothetical protein